MFTICDSSTHTVQTRLISLVCHLIISCDFSCTAAHAQHLDAWKVLQSSGSICRVFRRLSIPLVSIASRHCSVFSQALDSPYSRHFSVLFSLLPGQARSFFFCDLLRYLFFSLSVVIIFFFLLQNNPILKTSDHLPLYRLLTTNSNEISRQERMAFFRSSVMVTARRPSPSRIVRTDGCY